MKKTIAIIGTGYVGLVSGTCFSEVGHTVICCDKLEDKIDLLKSGVIPIYEPGLEEMVVRNVEAGRLSFTSDVASAVEQCDIVYIAVGTPMAPSGEANLDYVREAAKTIALHLNRYKVIVNKSTVPVGTGRMVEEIVRKHRPDKDIDFDVVSNPEFLREGTAIKDCMSMERAIVGANRERAGLLIAELHEPFHTRILTTDVETAEMIKYASNAFLATKISFINDIANICERVGADVTQLAVGMGLDSRIGSKFLDAGIGYGGSCFPKDAEALLFISKSAGYDFDLIKEVVDTNNRQRHLFVEKIRRAAGYLEGRTFGIMGLAFKPDTDDMRSAPSITIVSKLIEQGASVRAYDPIAIAEARKHLPEQVAYFNDPYEALEGCDACVILTEWKEIVSLDLDRVKKLLNAPVIVDGRNIYSLGEMEQRGFSYYSIGRREVVTRELKQANPV